MTPSVPRIIGALTWPIWAIRNAWPLQFADPDAEHHAAFLLAVALQRGRIVAVVHHHRRHRVGALGGLGDVEAEHLALGPDRDRAAHRFGQQAMAQERVFELPRRTACRSPGAARTADAPARCRHICGSARCPRARSSPNRACAGWPSCAPRGRGRWRRRSRGRAASSGPSASRTSRRRCPTRPSRTACSRARPRCRP